MAVKKRLGAEAEALFARGTAADAVNAAAGRPPLAAVPEEGDSKYKVTTMRILAEQFFAVQDEAVKRHREKRGAGKPDMSEVFREALAMWMAR